MAEDNKRKKTLVKLGAKDERYDSYGHKIEKPVSKPAPRPTPRPTPKPTPKPTSETASKQASKPVPKRTVEKSDSVKQSTKPTAEKTKEKKAPAKKLYGSVPEDKIAPHERRILEREPKRKKYIANVIKVVAVVLLVAIVVCIFVFGTMEKEGEIEQAFLTTGTIENVYNVNAHIIRDEYGVTAGFSGKMIAAVNDGDRVAAGAIIGYIVKPEYEKELELLRQTESKISAAQNAASYVENQHTELGFLNEQIDDLTQKLSAISSSSSTLSQYGEILKELNQLFNTKNEILMNADSTDSYITGLKSQRASILANLQTCMQEVKTAHAGVVSFFADGRTNVATEKNAMIASYLSKKGETGNSLSENALYYDSSDLIYTVGSDVTSGQTVARVTPDVNYYIAIDVSKVDYSVFIPGKKITVRAKSRDFSVEAAVEELLKYADKTYVLLKSSTGLAGSVSQRIVESELIIDYMNGLKVPKRALAEWDTAGLTARIAILRANYVSFVYVNVLAEDGEYAIITPSNNFVTDEDEGITSVRVNDIYVVNHENVTEGQIIGG